MPKWVVLNGLAERPDDYTQLEQKLPSDVWNPILMQLNGTGAGSAFQVCMRNDGIVQGRLPGNPDLWRDPNIG
jgi:hypothetical protein